MDINKLVLSIWKNSGLKNQLVPLLYNDLKENCILFIGSNPSFSEKGFRTILKETKFEFILKDLKKFYAFKQLSEIKINEFLEIQNLAKENHPYFKKINDFANKLNLGEWEHIDLLFIRETKQKAIEKLLKTNNDKINFIDKQIKLSLQIIEKLNPKLIVVCNAFASKIIQEKLSNNIKFENNIGTHTLKLNNGNKIPLFFSGMLSGQRALDNGTTERLEWHIKFAYNKTYKPLPVRLKAKKTVLKK